MMIHHYEAPCGPESAMAYFQGTFLPWAFLLRLQRLFQDETLKMGIVAAQGQPQKPAKFLSPAKHSAT